MAHSGTADRRPHFKTRRPPAPGVGAIAVVHEREDASAAQNKVIAARLGLDAAKWRRRSAEQRVEGLRDELR